jgi:chromatin remodeling complex protein RSC6
MSVVMSVSDLPIFSETTVPPKYTAKQQHKIGKELLKLDVIYDNLALQRKQMTDTMSKLKQSKERITLLIENPKKTANEPKKQRGLSTQFQVSPALCHFLEVPTGSLIARAEVTKYIHKYISDNELYQADNRSYIIPDETLCELLHTGNNTPIHIFDLQGKMNSHFTYEKSRQHQQHQQKHSDDKIHDDVNLSSHQ